MLTEGPILIHSLDKKLISKYLNDLKNYTDKLLKPEEFRNASIESSKLVELVNMKSYELATRFDFNISYYFKLKTTTGGYYDKDTNTIFINLALNSHFSIIRNGLDRTFNIYNIDFKSISKTFIHEFVHHIGHVLRKEKQGNYTLPKDWQNNYYKRHEEQQAHAIAYLERLKQELNIKKPEQMLANLRKNGLLHQDTINDLKKSDYKSWKSIMKYAIMAAVDDIKNGKPLPWQKSVSV